MSSTVSYVVHGAVAVIRMNAPPVNALGLELRQSIADSLSRALSTASVGAVVLIGSERVFSAGADVREFGTPLIMQEPTLRSVTGLLETSTKPTIAAVGGACMGGGLELALACHFRVAKHDAAMALPEVKLGIIPGAGGTQRLPRAVGLEIALDMMLTGKTIRADELSETGMFDEIVSGDLHLDSIAFADRLLTEGRPLKRLRDRKVENPHAATVLAAAQARIEETSKGQPAPLACVQTVALTLSTPFEDGLKLESQFCDWLIATPQSKALRHIFTAERVASKIPGVSAQMPARTVKQVGIIGAGPIGRSIAICCLHAGLTVVIVESDRQTLERGMEAIQGTMSKDGIDGADLDRRLTLLRTAPDSTGISACDLIIDSSVETAQGKQKVFEDIALRAKDGAILAASDPYTDLNNIAVATRRPQDVIGLHFFDPAPTTRTMEVALCGSTREDVLAACLAFAKRLDKVPVVCSARAGLIGDRMLRHYFTVVRSLVARGATQRQIERALGEFGMTLSPFRAGEPLGPASPLPSRTGKAQRQRLDDSDIVERCVCALANEGAHILEEAVAARSSDVDIISIHACGFPAHRGGVLHYANEIGLQSVLAAVKRFAEDAGSGEAGCRVAPLLTRLAAAGKGFG